MHRNIIYMWITLFLPLLGFGSVLEGTQAYKELEGVKVNREAKLTVASRTHTVRLFGAGMRAKKVAFFNPKVYVGELLMSEPGRLPRQAAEALQALPQQKAVVMRLTFLRDVSAEKVEGALRDGFRLNKVDVTARPIKAMLEAVLAGGEVKEGTSILFIGEFLPGGKEVVSFENAAGKLTSIEGENGSVRALLSAWLGEAPDSGLERFRGELLTAP